MSASKPVGRSTELTSTISSSSVTIVMLSKLTYIPADTHTERELRETYRGPCLAQREERFCLRSSSARAEI